MKLICINEISIQQKFSFQQRNKLSSKKLPCCFYEIYWERQSFRNNLKQQMLKSFPLRQPKFGGNNKISSRANTNKVEKITSSEASLLKRERECEKYLKSCMSSWFRSFCSDFYIMARSWEKSGRSKLLRNFCTSKMDLFEASVCGSVGYRKIRSLS